MSTENIPGVNHPVQYYLPDGRKVGWTAAGISAAGLVIGGSAWFIYSPHAAHIRERAALLFGRRKVENPNWSLHFPNMIDDSDNVDAIKTGIEGRIVNRISVYSYRLPNVDPETGKAITADVPESSVDSVALFPEIRDFQTLSELSMYASPLLHTRMTDGFRLNGVVIPERSRVPMKGTLQITHGSEKYIPHFGIRSITYGIVGVDIQTLAQLKLDEEHAREEQLATIIGKIVFVPISERTYGIKRNKGSFGKTEDRLRVELKKEKSFGHWAVDE